jgi:phosphoribosylanthranilate isomerase
MAKTKIYAGQIDNLTDARYFAAWYVNWMGFTMEKCISGVLPIQQIAAIKEWVDVESFVLEYSGLEDPIIILEHCHLLDIHNVKVGPFCPGSSLKQLQDKRVFKDLIFENHTPLNTLSSNIENEKEFVDHFIIKGQSNCQSHSLEETFKQFSFYFDVPDMASFIDGGNFEAEICEGIVVKGGEEEKVGLKSFAELDEVYELLFD